MNLNLFQKDDLRFSLGRDDVLKLDGARGVQFAGSLQVFDFRPSDSDPLVGGCDVLLSDRDQVARCDQFPRGASAGPSETVALICS
jgi:hypothetical protein